MKNRIFSGIKPTGDLHLGNYLGAIKNWIELQNMNDCIYSIVDLHAMTSNYDPKILKNNIFKAACIYLACGLDPNISVLMVQSAVKYHTELCWILQCITPLGWLERVPTYKEKVASLEENLNSGLLNYPVLMAADVILYKAEAVPVGEDQLPHLELAREILRRFNARFGDTFLEIKSIIGKGARVKGLDGTSKMGKSLDNCIYLHEDYNSIWSKISKAVTDPARIKKTDSGNPDICNMYSLHQLFSKPSEIEHITNGCRKAEIGCLQCKKTLTENINNEIGPIRAKYKEYLVNPDFVNDVLNDGNRKATALAASVMEEVYERVGIGKGY